MNNALICTRGAILLGVLGLGVASQAIPQGEPSPGERSGSDRASSNLSGSLLQAADRMIASCLEHAAATKLPPLSVVVVDASGALIAFKRQDGAMPVSAEAALLKARTAIRTTVPTAALAPAVAQDPSTRDAFLMLQLTGIPGGVPFSQGNVRVAGAVGVSGAQPEQDAGCAQRSVEAASGK